MAQTYEPRFREADVVRAGVLDWSAIFAGAIIALVVHFLLNLLGVGIGAATIDVGPARAEGPGGAAMFGWWAVAGIVAAFVGGTTAGWLSGRSGHYDPAIHGLLAWAVSTFVVVAAVAGLIGGASASATSIAGPLGAQANELRALEQLGESPQAEAMLRAYADRLADRMAVTAIASFIALIIGALASILGAIWVARRLNWRAADRERHAGA